VPCFLVIETRRAVQRRVITETVMFIDAHSVSTGTIIETEVCIVGAGAAGITLAREFSGQSFRVLLLESGGTEPDAATQDLYSGNNIGRPYFDPRVQRLRYFGGTTNHWAGRCALPDLVDFEVREGMPYTGWPFPMDHLIPWYQRAQTVCQLGPYGYLPSDWGIAASDIPEPFKGPHFICQVMQVSPPTRFGPQYEPELRRAENVSVYLYANALRFEASESGREVRQLSVGVLNGGHLFVRARTYVLAAGGIENARLLLLSDDARGIGLGNEHDLVGRFFMVHLEYHGGIIALTDPYMNLKFQTGTPGAVYSRFGVDRPFVSYACLSEQTRREMRLPHLRFRMNHKPPEAPQAVDAIKRLINRSDHGADILRDIGSIIRDLDGVGGYATRKILFGRGGAVEAIFLDCTSEQLPNPNSRIALDKDVDVFGQPKTTINWQLTTADKHGMAVGNRLFGVELGRAGFGRLRSTVSQDDVTWPTDLYGDEHNIGTTRMHREAAFGVVDEHCRVHSVANLYVAGSSVFPTSGAFNPTLTIVALALRLADHIKETLQ
jgi:choline dehydrogenase-like flavoprotein